MLGIGIEKIEYLEREKDLRADPYSKGVRLDVYVRDSSRVFTLEMQCDDRKDLPLRTRWGCRTFLFWTRATCTGTCLNPTSSSFAFSIFLAKVCPYTPLKTPVLKTGGFH